MFPDTEDFVSFITHIYKAHVSQYNTINLYKEISGTFSTIQDFFNNYDDFPASNSIVIFLCLKLKLQLPYSSIKSPSIYYPDKIIEYFHLVPDTFWEVFNHKCSKTTRRWNRCLCELIRMVIYLEKSSILEITYEEIVNLKLGEFNTCRNKSSGFISLFEQVHGIITEHSRPHKLKHKPLGIQNVGTEVEDICAAINQFLYDNYIAKGYSVKFPLSQFTAFFNWLTTHFENISSIKDLSSSHWLAYKEFIITSQLTIRTKCCKLDYIAKFFEWCQLNNYIAISVVDIGERYRVKATHKPRMFDSREDYKKILAQIFLFEPSNKCEELIKHYLLVASATGLRASEILWLGPDCLVYSNSNIPEIRLQIREKLNIKNKLTSILPWGIDSIKFLQQRFDSLNLKVKFYHQKCNDSFYSLFQSGEKILTPYSIYSTFNKILANAQLVDDKGAPISYRNVKMHGFRHQKFNDIYEITGGSATAVKVDSGHQTVEMAKVYTQQQEHKKQLQALELVNKGEVVGKGADFIKSILQTPYSIERYIKIVEKLNISVTHQELLDKKLTKFLGFGFCTSNSCACKASCERCDFFYTCNSFIDELSNRYSKNFALLKVLIGSDIDNKVTLKANQELMIDLKYQEKWLLELGLTPTDIINLKINGLEEAPNGSVEQKSLTITP